MTATSSSVPVYDSAQRQPFMLQELREVLRYQNLVLQLVRRDILTRYKRSVLGIAWTMLNPLGTMLVLTIAFSRVFQTRGYAVFVLTGLLSWTFFAQTTNAITLHIVWGGSLFKRIYVPRTTFALAAIGTGLVNVVVSIVPLIIVMLFTHVPLSPSILFLPVPILFLAMFSLGVGLLISTVAVYFADVAEMYQIVLTAWMYITPVIYPASYLPEQYRTWIAVLNPMYHLVQVFRTPVYEGRLPTLPELLISGGLSLGALLIGWYFFTKKSDEFAYRI